jgi:hypothetical protein
VLREEEKDIGGLIEGPPVRPLSRVHKGSADSTLSLPPAKLLLGVEIGGEGVRVIAEALGVAIRSLTESPALDCLEWGVESTNRTRLLAFPPAEVVGLTMSDFCLCSSRVAVISPRVSRIRLATTPLAEDRRESAAISSLELWKVVRRLINLLWTLEIAAVWLL